MVRALILLVSCLFLPLLQAEEVATMESIKVQVVKDHAKLASAMMADSATSARQLSEAVERFAIGPTEEALKSARTAWMTARKYYQPTECLRFYAGPIDDDDGYEAKINAWPMDEQVIEDMIRDEAQFPELTVELIEEANQVDGNKNVTCGFHAVEFLLWGQDTSETGPGNRSVTDFTTEKFAKRRMEYLRAVTALLAQDITSVADDWKADELGNYRVMFEESPDLALQRILTGMALLSSFELAGSRLQVALDSKEQEEEASCFSDTTQLDFVYNTRGMLDFWLGNYTRLDGTKLSGMGLQKWMEKVDPTLASELDRQFRASHERALSVPAPFDQAIRGADDAPGRVAVQRLILALDDQATTLRRVGAKLGFKIPMVADENLE